mgnify:FL=1
MALTPNEAYAAKQPFVDKETLEHIVEQFPTPFHLYDEAGIRRNMQEVRDAFAWNPGFKEYFAVKANPNPALSQFSTNTAAAAIARAIPSS